MTSSNPSLGARTHSRTGPEHRRPPEPTNHPNQPIKGARRCRSSTSPRTRQPHPAHDRTLQRARRAGLAGLRRSTPVEKIWGPPTYPATFVRHDSTPAAPCTTSLTSPEGDKFGGFWDITSVDEEKAFEFEDGFALNAEDFARNLDLPVSKNEYRFIPDGDGTAPSTPPSTRARRGPGPGPRDGHDRGRHVGDQPDRRALADD